MKFSKYLKPNASKIIISSVLTILFALYMILFLVCPLGLKLCPAASDAPGAIYRAYPAAGYFVKSTSLPLSGCPQVCSSGEAIGLYVLNILTLIILPFVIAYLVISLIQYLMRKKK